MNEYGIQPAATLAEPVASITHLAGAVLFAMLSVRMLHRAWNGPPRALSLAPRGVRVFSVAVFSASVVLLLSVSGLYHSTAITAPMRPTLLRYDYAAIFVLIAGSFTPPCAILFNGCLRYVGLGLIWGTAVGGIFLKCYMERISGVTLPFVFLGMGWLGIFAVAIMWRRHGSSFIEYAVLGGAAYTAGAAFQIALEPNLLLGTIGPHELLHVAVLIGIACHWRFIYQFAHGHVPTDAPTSSEPIPEIPAVRRAALSSRSRETSGSEV